MLFFTNLGEYSLSFMFKTEDKRHMTPLACDSLISEEGFIPENTDSKDIMPGEYSCAISLSSSKILPRLEGNFLFFASIKPHEIKSKSFPKEGKSRTAHPVSLEPGSTPKIL